MQDYSTEYQVLSIILKLFSVIVFFLLDLLLQNKKRGEGAGGEREGEILYSSIALPQENFATEKFNNQGFFFTPNGNLALKQPSTIELSTNLGTFALSFWLNFE